MVKPGLDNYLARVLSILQSPDDGTPLDTNFESVGGIQYEITESGILKLHPKTFPRSHFVYSNSMFSKWSSILDERINYYTKKKSIAGRLANYSYRSIRKFGSPKADEWILDIGCGDGSQIAYLPNRSHYIGLDTNLERLEVMKQNYPHAIAIYGDAAALPFKPGSIKYIFSSNAFEHIWYLKDAILELFRCMANDGLAIIVVPTEGGLWNIGRSLISKPFFRKKYPEIDFEFISHIEHCNNASQIVRNFETFFHTAVNYKPFYIPTFMLNVFIEIHAAKKMIDL